MSLRLFEWFRHRWRICACALLLVLLALHLLRGRSTCSEHCGREVQQVQDLLAAERRKLYSPSEDFKVWISISLCWSQNTQLFEEKKSFPYAGAAIRAAELWRAMTPNFGVVVDVVRAEDDADDPELAQYAARLEEAGATVRFTTPRTMSCSLLSQLRRMFAFADPAVAAGDIIVTADVDAFVSDPEIFSELKSADFLVWIFQYYAPRLVPMTFVAMTKELWESAIDNASPDDLVERYKDILYVRRDTWDYDQVILTRILLESRLCWVDAASPVWSKVGLDPGCVEFDDYDTCYHGHDYGGCNAANADKECKWWHASDLATEDELEQRYLDILKNTNTAAA